MDLTDELRAGLATATTYVATGPAAGAAAGGRWHVLPDGKTVLYERRPGEYDQAHIVPAHTLETSSSWTVES